MRKREISKVILIFVLGSIVSFLSSCGYNTANIWYVNKDAAGSCDGSSWADDFNNPMYVMNAAEYEDVVWVKQGVYTKRDNGDTVVLTMSDRVSIYGGFDSFETSIKERDYKNNITTLDDKDVVEHVVVGASYARLDWFTFSRCGIEDSHKIMAEKYV